MIGSYDNESLFKETVTINADVKARMVDDVKRNGRSENVKRNEKQSKEQKKSSSPSRINAESTEHMKTYKEIMGFYALFGKLFGSKISYNWIPHHHIMYFGAYAILFVTFFLIIYTILNHYKNGDYLRIVEPLALIGITISCALKWYGYVKYWPKLFSLLFFPRKLCRENLSGGRADIIAAGLRKTWSILKAYTVGVAASVCFFPAVPIYFYFTKGIKIPLLPIEFFFFDQSTLSGYLYASAPMLVMGAYAGFATIMYGSSFLICICNYTVLVDLVAQDFADLDEMWNGSNETTIAYRYSFLRNTCKKLQDIARYLDVVKEIYELKLFIYFLLNYVAQVICLYEIQKNDWIPGYTFLMVLFIEMLSYCLIGTQISYGDDKLCDMIYGTNWYTYDLVSQNVIKVLLHDCQKPKLIMLGNFGPLDVVTGSTIMKSIYSLYTVMMETM